MYGCCELRMCVWRGCCDLCMGVVSYMLCVCVCWGGGGCMLHVCVCDISYMWCGVYVTAAVSPGLDTAGDVWDVW